MSRPPLPDWQDGVQLHLTKHQRKFIASKVLKGLKAARANRARVEAKYGDAAVHADHVVNSLIGLGVKIGLGPEQLKED